MPKFLALLGVVALTSVFAPSARADLVVDFSPDTTGVPVSSTSITNSIGQFQVIGDQFTLLSDTLLTGASIFSSPDYGAVGTAVRFLIYSDPNTAPIIDITTTVDLIDSVSTTTQTSLNRKHASIASTFLAAGSYWFALPAVGNTNFTQGTGDYDNDSFRQGFFTSALPSTALGLGDSFFQLEAIPVPEPSSLALLALGLGALAFCRQSRTR